RGRREVGQPLARQGVPPGGVPRAVRAPLLLGRAGRPVPRAQAALAPARDRARRLGRGAREARPHQALLRLVHARDLGPRLRAAADRPRPRPGFPRGVPALVARGHLAPGELALVLHTHMPYVEGFGTWPFGEQWLFEAIATSYLPLLEVLGDDPPLTLSITPVLADQLQSAEVAERFAAFLRGVRRTTHRL